MADHPHVLFLCVHNAGKSQIAGAVMRQLCGDRVQVTTADTGAEESIDEVSARIVAELGASTMGEHPKAVTDGMLQSADRIILIGSEVQLQPAAYTDKVERWPIHDPAVDGVAGDERARRIRAQIVVRVRDLAAQLAR